MMFLYTPIYTQVPPYTRVYTQSQYLQDCITRISTILIIQINMSDPCIHKDLSVVTLGIKSHDTGDTQVLE